MNDRTGRREIPRGEERLKITLAYCRAFNSTLLGKGSRGSYGGSAVEEEIGEKRGGHSSKLMPIGLWQAGGRQT